MWHPFITAEEVPEAVAAALADVDHAIAAASRRVRGALKTARFATDADGRPTDPDVENAIKEATLAQLAFWADTGDETGAAAQAGGGSILSVTLPGGGGATDARSKQEAREAPAVDDILRSCEGITWEVHY
ncbi:hypothetical protein [Microbacterium sp. gxy059]|uniref:hypothetical protein n=1 Tax=Microbacterium sp. gxy059 TaxID=2957199 RepID=UPI003D98432D